MERKDVVSRSGEIKDFLGSLDEQELFSIFLQKKGVLSTTDIQEYSNKKEMLE